jgi:hypothetical protein
MSEQEGQHSASFGYAYIEAGVVACFSRDDLIVEMKFSETGDVATNIVRGGIMQTVFLERAEAEHFLSKVLEAARKLEVLSKYEAEVTRQPDVRDVIIGETVSGSGKAIGVLLASTARAYLHSYAGSSKEH